MRKSMFSTFGKKRKDSACYDVASALSRIFGIILKERVENEKTEFNCSLGGGGCGVRDVVDGDNGLVHSRVDAHGEAA